MNKKVKFFFIHIIKLFEEIESRRAQNPSSSFLIEAKEKIINVLKEALTSPELKYFPDVYEQIKSIVKDHLKPFTPSSQFNGVLVLLNRCKDFMKENKRLHPEIKDLYSYLSLIVKEIN